MQQTSLANRSPSQPTLRPRLRAEAAPPLLVVVEGANDINFLRGLSARLATETAWIPDLGRLEIERRILFVPIGGSHFSEWAVRFAGFGCREFHLYDGELPPETARREHAIQRVNDRENCRGFLTKKRSLENYLHPAAIEAAGGGTIVFKERDSVGIQLARQWYESSPQCRPWSTLTRRAQQRFAYRAKRWLNQEAVGQMTLALLIERDPECEVLIWFQAILELLSTDSCAE